MPKSKRNSIIPLSKVQKKTKDSTAALYTSIREAASAHPHILILKVSNMRNIFLQEIRSKLAEMASSSEDPSGGSQGSPPPRLFFGKSKVMAKALGTTSDEEVLPGVHVLTQRYMKGGVGLLFTSQPPSEIEAFFASYAPADFARAGTVATYTFTVPAGQVYSRGGAIPAGEDVPVPASREAQLRGQGMPTRLEKGKVWLDDEFVVAEEGRVLDSRAAGLLKGFGECMAEMRVGVVARYDAGTGAVVEVEGLEGVGGAMET